MWSARNVVASTRKCPEPIAGSQMLSLRTSLAKESSCLLADREDWTCSQFSISVRSGVRVCSTMYLTM